MAKQLSQPFITVIWKENHTSEDKLWDLAKTALEFVFFRTPLWALRVQF